MGYCERKEKNRLERRGERAGSKEAQTQEKSRQRQARAMQTKDAESIYSWAPYGAAHDCRIEKEKKKKKKALEKIVLLLMLLSPPFLKKS